MSIIYEALKKAEKTILTDAVAPVQKKMRLSFLRIVLRNIRRPLSLGIGSVLVAVVFIALFFLRQAGWPRSSKDLTAGSAPDYSVDTIALHIKEAREMSSSSVLLQEAARRINEVLPEEERLILSPPSDSSSLSEEKPVTQAASLSLNGIFFSQNEGYALINNQIVKEGDTVAGVFVKTITVNGVELEDQGNPLTLLTRK
ncbi:MAG: hypothetical protein KKC84_06110 [Candidatus Omnitrophica bacterium]|nr:hypothetical protein [Candidatus Omnitrophota bacterium]